MEPTNLALTIEAEILDFGNRRAAATLQGFDTMAQMSAAPPLARARAIDLVNRFMGLLFGCEVITVDLDEGFYFCWSKSSDGRSLSEPALDLALGAANLRTDIFTVDCTASLRAGTNALKAERRMAEAHMPSASGGSEGSTMRR